MTPVATQGSRLRTALRTVATVLVAACGGHAAGGPAPVSPEAAVRSFLNAVKANSLPGMGEAWGSSRGPAASYMERTEMDQRLTVIRAFLEHERFEILGTQAAVPPGSDRKRIVKVRLTR